MTLAAMLGAGAALFGLDGGQAARAADPTGAPLIRSTHARDVTATSATVKARIHPRGSETTYYFEYGTTPSYDSTAPLAPASLGSGSDYVTVSAFLGELEPDTTYHYRVVAENEEGLTAGPDKTFRTLAAQSTGEDCPNEEFRVGPSAGLPDCRAYEQVSPVDKNGGDIMADSSRVRLSADTEAVGFASMWAFADAQTGGIMSVDYIARRQDGRWSTHAITPPQPAGDYIRSANFQARYVQPFSPDLSSGLFIANSPLTDAPNVQGPLPNLYLRTNVLTPGPGDYVLVSDATVPVQPDATAPFSTQSAHYVNGLSTDLRSVVFEAVYALTPGAPLGRSITKLYVWRHGALRRVDRIPEAGLDVCGGDAAPTCVPIPAAKGVFGGAGTSGSRGSEQLYEHSYSTDGARLVFTVGQHFFDGRYPKGDLYLEDDQGTPDRDDDTIQHINFSERTDCAVSEPCTGAPLPDPTGPKPAIFLWGSTDPDTPTQVFFTTQEALTDDAPVSGAVNGLYRYDSGAPAGKRLELITTTTEAGQGTIVLGGSRDGSRIYFIASGDRDPSTPPSGAGFALYRWDRDGGIRHIADYLSDMIFIHEALGQKAEDLWAVSPGAETFAMIVPNRDPAHCPPLSAEKLRDPRCNDLFVYSAGDDTWTCVTCLGAANTAETALQVFAERGKTAGGERSTADNRFITDDGRFVYFSSAEALVPEDTNGRFDAYQYDVQTGEVTLLSTGKHPSHSYFMHASADGSSLLINTREQLVLQDQDDQRDIYDVRVNGGLESQQATGSSSQECTSPHSCRDVNGERPSSDPIGSDGTSSGNPAAQGTECSGLSRRARALAHRTRALRMKSRRASGPAARRISKRLARSVRVSRAVRRSLARCRRGQ